MKKGGKNKSVYNFVQCTKCRCKIFCHVVFASDPSSLLFTSDALYLVTQ